MGLATAVWGGVVADLDAAAHGSLALPSFLDDAGERQGLGGIVAFDDVTAGVPSAAGSTGFGTPRVAGLVAALSCRNVDCGERGVDFDPCGRGVCAEGGVCKRVPFADGTSCTADACTAGATCQRGSCRGGVPILCDDASTCTADSCDPDRGCVHDAVRDDPTCQLLNAPSHARRCGVRWLVEAETVAPHRVTCIDGDPRCDADGAPGQCTFLTALCASSGCEGTQVRIARPSTSEARRSSHLDAVRARVGHALARGLAPGRCTEAAPLVVPAGRTVQLQARAGRRATRVIRLTCRAE